MVNTTLTDRFTAAADAAASALGGEPPLVPGATTSGVPQAADLPAGDLAGVLARLDGPTGGQALLLVGPALASALGSTPVTGADLATTTRQALDALAGTLDAVVTAADVAEPGTVLATLGQRPGTVQIPLRAGGELVAVLVLSMDSDAPAQATASPARAADQGADLSRIGLLRGVALEVSAVLGRTSITVAELLSLTPGAVVELDREVGALADLLVNGTLIARGEVVVVDDSYGIRINEIVTGPSEAGA
jgi:flagellar motor switch protein FliN/FliY